ncbi:MAG: response regulator [Oscillatoria sp. SIO1A7]|nr:response regulator [Oscillatoria sp. SIO1A7]
MNGYQNDKKRSEILVVDDTPENLRLLSLMLANVGYEVRLAINGKMALKVALSHPPQLILLDIMMPDISGYEVCEKLKDSETTREIPVIFLSALDAVMDKVRAFQVGAADYITKPFQVEEVLARIDHQITIVCQQKKITNQNEKLQEQNRQLQNLNEELRRSNVDLEQFAYTASHDLQSPLQAIIGNADLLSWKYESSLEADAIHYIDEIVGASMRMKQLIQDLLAYSRVGTGNLELQPIDCQIVLKEAMANLRERICSSGADISHDRLPTVMGNKTQLIQVFQNLISNAIKFRRKEVCPKIQITAEALTETEEWLIGVRDNGIGIKPQNRDRIFEVFQRLHQSDEYPGSGIGMAICKKIVERHGGRIWVESQFGIGTTFYFTLSENKE